MSKEMREHINKVKNFGQFINEEESWIDKQYSEAEKTKKRNALEKELFYDIIKNLIDSNNVDKMNEYVNYMTGKLWLNLNQFIHQQIYKLKDKNVDVREINIDYNDLDKRIFLFKKREEDF